MGNAKTKVTTYYNKTVSEPNEGESAIYRNFDFSETLHTAPEPGMDTYTKILKRSFRKYADQPYLGQRQRLEDGSLEKAYSWETYAEVEKIGAHLGSGLLNKGLIETKSQYHDYHLKFVSVYSKNTREWLLLDVAAALYGFTLVPIYDTLGEEATQVMFGQTELPTLFLTVNHISAIVKGIKAGTFDHLKTLIVMDPWNLTDTLKE